ncbi:MAG: aconitate hydratase, partial [Rhizobacter sp.]|nr:aconitate hydratase [Rhizobacter sp.]
GSQVVTDYLSVGGLLEDLNKLRFNVVGYGCTTCIGNSGPLPEPISKAIEEHKLITAAVLSGNRNFEGRVNPLTRYNYLASPPLVVAYAIAGTMLTDLMTEPVGQGADGEDVWLGDIWPTSDEIHQLMKYAMNGKTFQANYGKVKTEPGELWEKIKGVSGETYTWPKSTYIAEPPFFKDFKLEHLPAREQGPGEPGKKEAVSVRRARVMALFGDSITTDHISPAGSIKEQSPAGEWLKEHGVQKADFNSYGSRRGNHDVMVRGTFANVRIKNLMIPAGADGSREEGGLTLFQPGNEKIFIYDAAMKYMAAKTPTIIFAGEEYGTGSSRDWAAKGTALLGIKAVVARSYERIHRANLVGMGVLPLQFKGTDSWQTLGITGDETFDVLLGTELKHQQDATLVIHDLDGGTRNVRVTLRIDTPIEVDYYKHGGILPFVLRQLLAA